MKVCLLAGGTGGARLAVGLQSVLAPGALTVVTNTGDDLEHWGLYISPDTDSVLYMLAGIFNEEAGFGVAGDTFATLEMMRRLSEPGWFWLGDRDLAVHIFRTAELASGRRLTEVALELCRRLEIPSRVMPMSDQPVRTWFETAAGRLSFQEYFVRHRCQPALHRIDIVGLDEARAPAEVAAALAEADLVVIGPSNPLVSIGPILAVVRPLIDPDRTLAVSPIVGGRALKGPTVEMMAALGRDPTPEGVAREYAGLAAWYVLDDLDSDRAAAVEAEGYRVIVSDTVMTDAGRTNELARTIVGSIGARR